MAPQISERGRIMPASPIRKLMPLADEAKRRGVRVYQLNIGQPDLETPPSMRGEARPGARPSSPTRPRRERRSASPRCGSTTAASASRSRPTEIVATTGGSEAILFALTACADDGDEALVAEPFYTNYIAFATMAGVRLVPLRARGEDGFHLPPIDEWKKALTPRTQLVLLCNPNNPTGTVYRRDELDDGRGLLPGERPLPGGRRGVPRVRLRRPRRHERPQPARVRGDRGPGRTASRSATAPAGSASAASPRATRTSTAPPCAWRRGGSRPPASPSSSRSGRTSSAPTTRRASCASTRRDATCSSRASRGSPGSSCASPRAPSTSWPASRSRTARTSPRWLLTDYGFDGATVLVAPAQGFYATPGLGRDEVRIAYVLKKEDLEASVRILAHAIPTYQAVQVARLAGARTRA